MKYAYYPGCSLTGTAKEFDTSVRSVMSRLGVELNEIPDWTCCGASAVESVSRLLTYALPARNLALSENQLPGQEILVPCSACYLNLYKAREKAAHDHDLKRDINEALSVEGLTFTGEAGVRHILDVLANDVGPDKIKENVSKSLEGLVVAPYYGCQILRPYRVFDDPEHPVSMDALINATGASVHEWGMGPKCCGASLSTTKKHAAMESVAAILAAAKGADVIVTVCPMCQMNLEAFQDDAFKLTGQKKNISILYLTQLLGLAMGLPEGDLELKKNLVFTGEFRNKINNLARLQAEAAAKEAKETAASA